MASILSWCKHNRRPALRMNFWKITTPQLGRLPQVPEAKNSFCKFCRCTVVVVMVLKRKRSCFQPFPHRNSVSDGVGFDCGDSLRTQARNEETSLG